MRVALVNPNRYLEPPVIPLGIEYLAHYLDREGHEVEVIGLAFTADPEAARRALMGSGPLFRIEGLERRSNYERLS